MAYGDFKDLARGTASDKVLRDKVFNIAKSFICDKNVLLLWFINFLMNKSLIVVLIMKLNKMSN